MKVSIITPTADRPHFLMGLYTLIQKQTYPDWEWLIYDSSLRAQTFSDSRVIYQHDEAILSIGEKRNRLIERASGDVIVHCDDDDYYAPHYVAYIVDQLKKTDFFKTHSWFSYDLKSQQTYYWATDEYAHTQFSVNALIGERVREIDFGSNQDARNEQLNQEGRFGYGFSYAYTKGVASTCPFQDFDFGEDRMFYESVKKNGFSIAMEADQKGNAIHVIHETNISGEYPQYRIPHFLVEKHLPDFFSYMSKYHEN